MMRILVSVLAGIAVGCMPKTSDLEDFLLRFPTEENRNRVTLSEGNLRYDIHVLTSEFLAARELTMPAGAPRQELHQAFNQAKARYESALYFLIRIEADRRSENGGKDADSKLLILQQYLQTRQESLRENIRLRALGKEDLRPTQVIVTPLPGFKPSISMLIAFPASPEAYRKWEYLSLAGIQKLPLNTDIQLSNLRPKLRLEL